MQGHGAFAVDVHGGLQGAACPGCGTQGGAIALVWYIAGGGDHQPVLDFGTTAGCGGAGVDKGDGDMAVHGAAAPGGVSHIAHAGDVGVHGLEAAQHAAAVGKAGIRGGFGA